MDELAIILIDSVIFTALLAVTLVFLETMANPSDRRYLYSLITKLRLQTQRDSVWTTVKYFCLRHKTALLVLIVIALVCFYLVTREQSPSRSASSTIQFYDVEWSKDRVTVGEEIAVKGKFYVFPWRPKQWPYVGILRAQGSHDEFSPIRSSVGGVPVGTTIRVEPGNHYEFNLTVKAEKEGDGTLAVVMDLPGRCLMGPGKSISIEESSVSDFQSDKSMEAVVWVALFIVIGGILALPEARRRLVSIATAAEVGFVLLSVSILTVLYLTRNDLSIMLRQKGIVGVPSERVESSGTVAVTIKHPTYRSAERTTTMEVTVKNDGSEAVFVEEYETAGKRFLANTVSQEERYPAQFLVSQGLDVDNKSPVTPGKSQTMLLRISETTGSSDGAHGTDNRVGGLLFLKDTAGSRYMVPVPTNIGAKSTKVSPVLLLKD